MVYPRDGPTTKDTGRRLAKFGPLKSFSLDYSDKKEVKVREEGAANGGSVHTAGGTLGPLNSSPNQLLVTAAGSSRLAQPVLALPLPHGPPSSLLHLRCWR